MNSIFTDQEHRILLSAISRERKVCEECDREIGDNDGYMLVPIVDSIERKVYEIQHQDVDLKKHFLVATEPEWDQKNRFHRWSRSYLEKERFRSGLIIQIHHLLLEHSTLLHRHD